MGLPSPRTPSDEGRSGRSAYTATRLHGRAWEIVALTDGNGNRMSRRRRWEHFCSVAESGSGPVDGWALANANWNEIKAFVQRVPADREVEAWSVVVDGLDRLGDVLADLFGDLRGWRSDGVDG